MASTPIKMKKALLGLPKFHIIFSNSKTKSKEASPCFFCSLGIYKNVNFFYEIRKYTKFLHKMSSSSALLLGVKWIIAVVAEVLPPRNYPFAALRRDRRFRFS